MKEFFRNRSIVITLTLLSLIVLHGLFNQSFKVDNVSLLLVILIIILPYLKLVNRIKYGDFEAEISPQDIQKVENTLKSIPQANDEVKIIKKQYDLETIAEQEPNLALAKARIEIERRVRSLTDIYLKETGHRASLRKMISELGKEKLIDRPIEALLHDVVEVANQAIHGATIQKDDAIKLASYANRAIEELDRVVTRRALKTSSAKLITPASVQHYEEAKYTLKTIVPLAKKPYMNTYTLSQSELDAFLEGYDEHAEFIVELERQNEKAPAKGISHT